MWDLATLLARASVARGLLQLLDVPRHQPRPIDHQHQRFSVLVNLNGLGRPRRPPEFGVGCLYRKFKREHIDRFDRAGVNAVT